MKEIFITRAAAIGDQKIDEITIIITGSTPKFKTLKEAEYFFTREAAILAEALRNSLPGGTLDRLIGGLFISRGSQFIVPLFRKEDEENNSINNEGQLKKAYMSGFKDSAEMYRCTKFDKWAQDEAQMGWNDFKDEMK